MSINHKILKERASKVKVALFDVDGTLLNSKGEVSQATRDAIRALRNRGVITGLATGRPLFLARVVLGELVHGPAIVCAGASVVKRDYNGSHWEKESVSPDDDSQHMFQEIYTSTMPEGLVSLTETLKGAKFPMLFTNNQGSTLVSDIVDTAAEALLTYYPKKNSGNTVIEGYNTLTLKEALEKIAPLKLDIPFVASERRGAFERIMQEFPQFQTQFASGAAHPEMAFVSVLPSEATRPRAFAELINHLPKDLGVISGENLFVIGDGESDLGLFDVAGVAVAMGNAPEIVKERAHHVTRSVEEDGVATFIREFLL